MIKEITVPDIGNYSNVEIIEVAMAIGASIQKEDALITLETEKASMDVPSPVAGTIKEIKIKLGDRVSAGDLIALVEVADEATATTSAAAVPEVKESASRQPEKITVTVPDIGASTDVPIIEVAVQPGDTVTKEAALITLESEKASMDIPSPYAGKIEEVFVKVGDKVSAGDKILIILAQPDEAKPAQLGQSTKQLPQNASSPSATKKETQGHSGLADIQYDFSKVHAGPATRRMARELGVDLNAIKGTGRKDRITTKDVQVYVKSIMQKVQSGGGVGLGIEKAPEIDFTQFGEIENKPLSRIKKWTAKNLYRNWVTIPHVTQFDEADITELEAFRQKNKQAAEAEGIKLTPLAFIIKAVVSGLKTFPQFNASLASNGGELILKKYYHVGIAVDTPEGLVVPVVRNADSKSLFEIAKELGQLSATAREGKLKAEQMQGGCFTISSLGGVGGTAFTPIINAPEVAILGLSKAQLKPVYQNNQFVPRKMLPLSLSYDHRVIDGVEGAKFITHLVEQLQDIQEIIS